MDKGNQRPSACETFQKRTLSIDVFGRPFKLILPDNKTTYKTQVGAILSLLTGVTIMLFIGYKLDSLLNLIDYKVQVRA